MARSSLSLMVTLLASLLKILLNTAQATPEPSVFAARPNFEQPLLSPTGKRVALIASQPNGSSTLLVVDVSGTKAVPITRFQYVDMPRPGQYPRRLKSIESFGWVSDGLLLVWARTTKGDDVDEFAAFAMDINKKRAEEIDESNNIDLYLSHLVTAPFRNDDRALVTRCGRPSVMVSKLYIVCGLRLVPRPDKQARLKNGYRFQAYPSRFFVSRTGGSLKVEGRRIGGRLVRAVWNFESNGWQLLEDFDDRELLEEWDSSEEDYPELWLKIHEMLPQTLAVHGEVVKAAGSGEPVGIQYHAPSNRFVVLDPALVDADAELLDVAARVGSVLPQMANPTMRWLAVSDDRDRVLLSMESAEHPQTYYLWTRSSNRWLPITDSRTFNYADISSSKTQLDWLPGVPVGITDTLEIEVRRGLVLMPLVVSDSNAAAALQRFDTAAQWFAANGLLVIHVPVGTPQDLQDDAAAWRRQVAQRLASVKIQAKQKYKDLDNKPVCALGNAEHAYAALAASAFGTSFNCVIAFNPRLEAKNFARPYTYVGSVNRDYFLKNDNLTLRTWRALYGADQASGEPGAWNYPNNTQVFLSYNMQDDQRALFDSTSAFKEAVAASGGGVQLYYVNAFSNNIDQWLSNRYQAMLDFMFPASRRKKIGIIEIDDVPP
ncbi:MAG: hypothetical protein QM808_06630 [Steroidobacteraceae bacterium]